MASNWSMESFRKVPDDPFIGADLHYGDSKASHPPYQKNKEATKWYNRRPICPYGCGEEGQLVEIVVKPDGQAVGYYKDSEQLVFTAPLKMAPKPSTRKIVRGLDGELTEVDSDT